MKNLIKRVTVLALCFTLTMSCVVEATPQDLQNMTAYGIAQTFKENKLKVKKAKYFVDGYIEWFVHTDLQTSAKFKVNNKKNNDIEILVCYDSEDAINLLAQLVWSHGNRTEDYYYNSRYTKSSPKYELYRRGNVILRMNTKISKKVRNKYKKVIKDIYNRPAEVADQK